MSTLRDTTMWTIAAQGTAPDGARVVLHRTRLGARFELVVGPAVAQSFGPGCGAQAHAAFDGACESTRRAA